MGPGLARARRGLRRALPALAAYAAVRGLGVLLVVGWALGHHIAPITRLGTLWDAGWYARIADHGYSVTDGLIGAHGIPFSPRAFFPLYPWLGHLASRLTGLGTAGGLVLVSWTASLLAAWGVFAIADRLGGPRVGRIAVVLWGVLPLAVVESYGYSEPLFTALSAWCLYALLRRWWLTAGLLCVAAGLTRPSATALVAAVAVAALVELRRGGARPWRSARARRLWRPIAAALLAPLGWLGYLAYTAWAVGSPTAYFHIQAAWDTGVDFGWTTLRWYGHEVTKLFAFGHEAQRHAFGRLPMALTGLAYLGLLVAALRQRGQRRQPLPLLVFAAGLFLVDFVNASPQPPIARFLLPAFPLLYPAAEWLADRQPRLIRPLLAAAAIGSACYGVALTFHGGAPS
ncbi:glycosyltransferase family 39 protein [Streptacidiphilus jiangxiensis]|uniref:Dolichyl-phosphate-mannose-protein mannosyltransferase n=1 Tax=Streptacidiphilus jiangxiensis TaxID=235985 RepID=A0A1H8ABR7_STRJI|nr:glycosyltransferase family 39 protein [Streptacidiphilus jiangxiensis]SEM67258.1 Dolichyl-phosphate-mannose-protein mannosyltransferase [Streptacidiphilus jiangxiensis]